MNKIIDSHISSIQAGAWPIGQSNLPTFAIPQELEKSVRMVSGFTLTIELKRIDDK